MVAGSRVHGDRGERSAGAPVRLPATTAVGSRVHGDSGEELVRRDDEGKDRGFLPLPRMSLRS